MKKVFMFIVLTASLIFAKEYGLDDVICKEDNNAELFGAINFGTCKDKSGKLIDGDIVVYHQNGKLALEAPYKNGKANGILKSYYESGQLLTRLAFKNGKADGIFEWYDELDNLRKMEFFNQDAKLTIYHEKNDLVCKKSDDIEICKHKDGVLVNGNVLKYSRDGMLLNSAIYKNGKINSIKIIYPFFRKDPYIEVPYKNGVKKGQAIVKYPDGYAIIPYKNNKANGIMRIFGDDILEAKAEIKDNKLNGIAVIQIKDKDSDYSVRVRFINDMQIYAYVIRGLKIELLRYRVFGASLTFMKPLTILIAKTK